MVFLSRLDLMLCEFVYNTVSVHGHENLHFDPFSFEGRVSKICIMFAWTVISVIAYVVLIHQIFIKAITLSRLTDRQTDRQTDNLSKSHFCTHKIHIHNKTCL